MSFLIRTKENRISGPFPKEVILARMKSGELREMDEVCPSDGYWIYLHEREESLKMLGMALARIEDVHEEATETNTETVTVTQPLAAPYTAKDMIREARETVNANLDGELEHQKNISDGPSENRPEPMGTLVLVLWVFAALIVFILVRIYQTATPV